MKDIRDMDVMELITLQLLDRAGRIYMDAPEYKECARQEKVIFEQLIGTLSEEQAKAAEKYLASVNSTAAVIERLTYLQGMKDMFAIIQKMM